MLVPASGGPYTTTTKGSADAGAWLELTAWASAAPASASWLACKAPGAAPGCCCCVPAVWLLGAACSDGSGATGRMPCPSSLPINCGQQRAAYNSIMASLSMPGSSGKPERCCQLRNKLQTNIHCQLPSQWTSLHTHSIQKPRHPNHATPGSLMPVLPLRWPLLPSASLPQPAALAMCPPWEPAAAVRQHQSRCNCSAQTRHIMLRHSNEVQQ